MILLKMLTPVIYLDFDNVQPAVASPDTEIGTSTLFETGLSLDRDFACLELRIVEKEVEKELPELHIRFAERIRDVGQVVLLVHPFRKP